jgi:hypothetical protein
MGERVERLAELQLQARQEAGRAAGQVEQGAVGLKAGLDSVADHDRVAAEQLRDVAALGNFGGLADDACDDGEVAFGAGHAG